MSSGVDRNAQPFSTQTGGQHRKTITKFVEAFEQSGNDVAGLLTQFLETSPVASKAVAEVKSQVRDVLRTASTEAERTLDQLVGGLRMLHGAKTTKDREKLRIMSLLAPLFTRADLVRRGFKVSNDAFANARRHATNQGAGAPVGAGGRPRLYTPELAATIDHFCCRPEFSYVNPSFLIAQQTLEQNNQQLFQADEMIEIHDQYGEPRLIPLRAPIFGEGGKEIPNRILRVSVHTLHMRFSEEHPQFKLALQGFRSLLPKNAVKRPRDPEGPLSSSSSLALAHNMPHSNGAGQDAGVDMGLAESLVSDHLGPNEMEEMEDPKPRKRGRPGKGPTQPSMTVSHQGLAVSAPAPPSALQHQMHPHSHAHQHMSHTLAHEVMGDHHDGGASQTMNPLEMDLHGHHTHHVLPHGHGHPHPHEALHMAGHEMQLAHHMHPEDEESFESETDAAVRPPTRKRPKITKK